MARFIIPFIMLWVAVSYFTDKFPSTSAGVKTDIRRHVGEYRAWREASTKTAAVFENSGSTAVKVFSGDTEITVEPGCSHEVYADTGTDSEGDYITITFQNQDGELCEAKTRL